MSNTSSKPAKHYVMTDAMQYLERGFSVIPVTVWKKPLIEWAEYQKRRATPEEVAEWFKKWPDAQIAIVTGSISGVVVIDIDDPVGFDVLKKYIPEDLIIPSVTTPSGGKHLYFKCPASPLGNNAKIIPGCDFRGEGGYVVAPPSRSKDFKQYLWVMGRGIAEVELPDLPGAYIAYVNRYLSGGAELPTVQVSTPQVELFTQGRRDEDLFTLANSLVKSGMPPEQAEQYVLRFAEACNPPFPVHEARIKVASALKRFTRRELTLSEEVRQVVESFYGTFKAEEVARVLRFTDRAEYNNMYQILGRLVEEGLIEKDKRVNGMYRRPDDKEQLIDIYNVSTDYVHVKWPFSLESWVYIMPKNIVVIAGEPNAGKTAFLLNVARMNMHEYPTYYFSSEMGALELRERLVKFEGMTLDDWKNVRFSERMDNFSDVIVPDALNLVDFLEVTDEFYKVGHFIKQMFDKLDKGICVIAIQKNRGNELGLGGYRGLEKARLYLALEFNRIKIVKAKNWAKETNPNGLSCQFKLVNGARFLSEEWKREN